MQDFGTGTTPLESALLIYKQEIYFQVQVLDTEFSITNSINAS